ncbi:MAG: hypothetical protein K2P01_04590, partial [Oscillospiraceae bacterium]|nr:hypothetical protein [Oscillospiraceae bacterium]
MNSSSTLYKKKGPLVVFLVPAFLFLVLYLYYPFVQNIINSFSNITGLGAPAQDAVSPECKADLFANVQNVVTGAMTA